MLTTRLLPACTPSNEVHSSHNLVGNMVNGYCVGQRFLANAVVHHLPILCLLLSSRACNENSRLDLNVADRSGPGVSRDYSAIYRK
jgi:hypothetical protein